MLRAKRVTSKPSWAASEFHPTNPEPTDSNNLMQVKGEVFYKSEDDHSPGIRLSIERQMRGDGDIDFSCGACSAVLGENLGKPFFKR